MRAYLGHFDTPSHALSQKRVQMDVLFQGGRLSSPTRGDWVFSVCFPVCQRANHACLYRTHVIIIHNSPAQHVFCAEEFVCQPMTYDFGLSIG